jgi:transketolase
MSSLMKARAIYVFTHDSIGLGEDGPTHQPVEHVASLRMIPRISLWRPCDTVETAVAWKAAIERADGPTCLVLTRQGLKHQARSKEQLADIARGGYILRDTDGLPEAIIIATGSEVALAVDAAEALSTNGRKVRVVSMPSTDAFDAQDEAYRDKVLPRSVTARVAVEAGIPDFWRKYVGLDGRVLGISTFGESAPAKDVFAHFGFSAANLARLVEEVL